MGPGTEVFKGKFFVCVHFFGQKFWFFALPFSDHCHTNVFMHRGNHREILCTPETFLFSQAMQTIAKLVSLSALWTRFRLAEFRIYWNKKILKMVWLMKSLFSRGWGLNIFAAIALNVGVLCSFVCLWKIELVTSPNDFISVFGMLLGDTIILDNLSDATSYRQEVCSVNLWIRPKNTLLPSFVDRIKTWLQWKTDCYESLTKTVLAEKDRRLRLRKLRNRLFFITTACETHTLPNDLDARWRQNSLEWKVWGPHEPCAAHGETQRCRVFCAVAFSVLSVHRTNRWVIAIVVELYVFCYQRRTFSDWGQFTLSLTKEKNTHSEKKQCSCWNSSLTSKNRIHLSLSNDSLADMLETYKAAVDRRINIEEELQEHMSVQNAPEMLAKVNECKEAEEQLKAIEERLGEFLSNGKNEREKKNIRGNRTGKKVGSSNELLKFLPKRGDQTVAG